MKNVNSLVKVGEILIMIGAILWCITIIGLIWGIPMYRGCKERIDGTKEITAGHIVVSLLFYWTIGAILVLIGNATSDTKIK